MTLLDDLQMVAIAGGSVRIGSTRDEVQHAVDYWAPRLCDSAYTQERFAAWIEKEHCSHQQTLAPHHISRFPITNLQYTAFLEASGRAAPESIRENEGADHPVWGVSRLEATMYAAWASSITGHNLRLPTETEWEHASRGQSDRDYCFGNRFDSSLCNTLEANHGGTTSVHAYEDFASDYGVCDLAGNVEEWVSTNYTVYPNGTFIDDDLVETVGPAYAILRGGSFARNGDLARSARRHGPFPLPVFRYTGFRLAMDEVTAS